MSLKEKEGSFNPEQLRLDRNTSVKSRKHSERQRVPRHQDGEQFLKGPIPLNWLARAADLPGKALQLSLALWYRAGLEKRGDIVLGNAVCAQFGVDRHAKRRALMALEQAGLVEVVREQGKNPKVTLLGAGDYSP